MKKPIFFILTLIFCFGIASHTSADVLGGANCTVSAKVIDKGSEMRKVYGTDESFREYESKYLKLEIFTTQKAGAFGDCSFVKIGDVFKIEGGSDPEPLNTGDRIAAGVESNSSMGPSGVVQFIQWKPISLIGDSRLLPAAFELQSSAEPEVINKKLSTSPFSIFLFFAVIVLLAGGVLYFLSRQRKT